MQQQFNPDNALTQQEYDELIMHLSKSAVLLKKYSVSLSLEERRGNRSVGRKREAYVRHCLRVAKANEHILPRNLDVNKFEQTLVIFDQHKDIQVKLSEIIELADDTQLSIGRELMTFTDTTYGAFKLARIRDSSMDRIYSELEEYNTRTFTEEENIDEE